MKLKENPVYRSIIFIIMAGFFSGFVTGIPVGLFFEKSAISGKLYLPALCFRPSKNFYELLLRLDDIDDFKRLAGYYLYKDTGIIDLDFLFERYRYDEIVIIRKTIVWIASGEKDKEKLYDFYGKIFEISTPELQDDIIKHVAALGKDRYRDFILRHKIKKD